MAHVGFLGLGTMGTPLAGHVLRREAGRGGGLTVHHRAPERVAGLLAAGAVWAPSPAEVARGADLVVFVLPTIADIRATLFGPEGVLAGAGQELVLVVCSTCSAREVRDLDREVRAATGERVRVVDAPLSGGQEGAEAGTLSIMVGGPDADAALAADVLGAGGRAVHLGPLGAGQIAKACNQLIVAATVAANAEVAVVAERSGLDLAKLFDLLQGGYAASRVMEAKARRFVDHDHSPSGPAKFMVKDLRAYAEAAADTGTRSLLAPTLAELFTTLTHAGLGDLDTAVVQRWVEDPSPGCCADRLEEVLPPAEILLEDDEGQLRAPVRGFEQPGEDRAVGHVHVSVAKLKSPANTCKGSSPNTPIDVPPRRRPNAQSGRPS